MHETNNFDKLSNNEIFEDDKQRSHYFWKLLCEPSHIIHTVENQLTIPRILIQFWDNAKFIPLDVSKCIDSWKLLDKHGFTRLLFDDESAKNYIMDNYDSQYLKAFNLCHHPAMRADYFRLCYLFKIGGFYVDADDVYKGTDIEVYYQNNKLKIQPLCYDTTTDKMVDISNLSTLDEHSVEYIYYANNDPIIAPPYHPVIKIALERATICLLEQTNKLNDIQSITGPGNLTASIVKYSIETEHLNNNPGFIFLHKWNKISFPMWPLDYRKDKRNWRLWDGSKM